MLGAMRSSSRTRGARAALAVLSALIAPPTSANALEAALFVERIDADTPASHRTGGPDSVGGAGDWALGNGTLCAVVADPSHEGYLLPSGGSLVDLGFCGRDDDQWANLELLANLSREGTLRIDALRAEHDADGARVVASAERDGVAIETAYEVDLARPRVLRVVTRATRHAEGARVFALSDVTVHNDGTLRPFTLARSGRSEGFEHGGIGRASVSELVSAIAPVDRVVFVGPTDERGAIAPISYALRLAGARLVDANGDERALPTIGISTETVTMTAVFMRPFWFGDGDHVGALELAQTLFMDIEVGETAVFEREIEIEKRIDGRAATDALYEDGVLVRGRIAASDARIHAEDENGSALAFAAPDSDGHFALRLPRRELALRVRASAAREVALELDLGSREGDVDLGEVALPEAAYVAIPPDLAPARVVFRGEDGTPDPVFGDDLTGFRIAGDPFPAFGASSDLVLGGFAGDPVRVAIAPGRYVVRATRGPEFGVSTVRIEARAGQTTPLELDAPLREVETEGFVAADLHVHAAPSDDSTVPMETRLASFLAEGGEVLVSTDHDNVSDYAPLVASLGLRDRVRTIVGLEVTGVVKTDAVPASVGHHNVFPLPYRPALHRAGALRSEDRRLREIVAEARSLPGERLVQVNHPRPPRTIDAASDGDSFFEHLSLGRAFDPEQPIDAEPNASLLEPDAASGFRDVDFDAVELLNGPSLDRYRAVRADWFALLRQGFRRTGTANSDTHARRVVAAIPRNYVRAASDAPSELDEAEFVASVKRGASYGTTGPLLDVRVGDAGPGDLARVDRSGSATLHVGVRTASWVPVSQLRVYVDGALVVARPIAGPIDFDLVLDFARDAFVVVEVEGAPDATYAALLPGFTPFAFTNPIFVDADRDGAWTPPGIANGAQPLSRDRAAAR